MHRIGYPVVNRGAARIGTTEASWWAGFEQIVEVKREPEPEPVEDVAYSSSITRPACSCKILGQGGCSVPTEGFPGGPVVHGGNGNGEGPSPLVVAGGVAGAGLLLAFVTGLL